MIGFEDGRFYANGWHITGEMGGVWTEPLKLVDGVWFGIDGEWVGPATKFTSGWGYAKFDLPSAAGLTLERTDFAPDGRRAALFGLKMTNPGASSRTVTVKVDAHSELMTEYPWGFDRRDAQRGRQPARHGAVRRPGRGTRLPRPGQVAASECARARLRGDGGLDDEACRGRGRSVSQRLPRAAGHERLHGRGAAERVRRRPVRQGQGRPAALRGHRARRRLENALGRRGGLRQGDGAGARASCRLPSTIRARSSRTRWPRASAGAASPGSRCRATSGSRRPSTGASRTSSISPGPRRTCRSAGPTRASSSRRPWARSRAPAGWAPASPTIRGCSAPTASTPRSRASPSGSSRRSRTTCARCATSRTCSTTAPGS